MRISGKRRPQSSNKYSDSSEMVPAMVQYRRSVKGKWWGNERLLSAAPKITPEIYLLAQKQVRYKVYATRHRLNVSRCVNIMINHACMYYAAERITPSVCVIRFPPRSWARMQEESNRCHTGHIRLHVHWKRRPTRRSSTVCFAQKPPDARQFLHDVRCLILSWQRKSPNSQRTAKIVYLG